MSQLRVGDRVLAIDGSGRSVFFDEVYGFGHALPTESGLYLNIEVEGDHMPLWLSPRHFLPTCPKSQRRCVWAEHVFAYAQDMRPGDYIWAVSSEEHGGNARGELEPRKVLNVSSQQHEGLYNPYTLEGNIVVNGIVTSCHSDWFLDDAVPLGLSPFLPSIYQLVLSPFRFFYHITGPRLADTLDVNNPQFKEGGYVGEVVVASSLVALSVVVAALACRRERIKKVF